VKLRLKAQKFGMNFQFLLLRVKLHEILKSLFVVSKKVLITMMNSLFKEDFDVSMTEITFENSEFVSDDYDSEFIGEFIAEGFALYDLGSYPGIIHCESDKVKGELYSIDNKTLNKLDRPFLEKKN